MPKYITKKELRLFFIEKFALKIFAYLKIQSETLENKNKINANQESCIPCRRTQNLSLSTMVTQQQFVVQSPLTIKSLATFVRNSFSFHVIHAVTPLVNRQLNSVTKKCLDNKPNLSGLTENQLFDPFTSDNAITLKVTPVSTIVLIGTGCEIKFDFQLSKNL